MLICVDIDKFESNQEPRFLTVLTEKTPKLPTRIEHSLNLESWYLEPLIVNSVLSSFIINLSCSIYVLKSRTQFSIAATASSCVLALPGLNDRYDWKSSAKQFQVNVTE